MQSPGLCRRASGFRPVPLGFLRLRALGFGGFISGLGSSGLGFRGLGGLKIPLWARVPYVNPEAASYPLGRASSSRAALAPWQSDAVEFHPRTILRRSPTFREAWGGPI